MSPARPTASSVWRQRASLLLWILLCRFEPALPAHDSPEHVIQHLSGQIARVGETASLLYQRGTEHRVLNHPDAALQDFRKAVELDPHFLPARAELARVLLEQGKTREAIAEATRALALARDDGERAPFSMIRAEARAAAHDDAGALADCEMAFRGPPAELDWYLMRGQIQARLGRWEARCAGLKAGFDRTGSAVLEIEWIESLLDAGHPREALRQIEPQLAESRWRSSWLLSRARARLALGQDQAARADLAAALEELNRRLVSPRPDLTLLTDRGYARALLGEIPAARQDLATAKQLGADLWVVRRLEQFLKSSRSLRPPADVVSPVRAGPPDKSAGLDPRSGR